MAYAELASGRPDASGGAYVWVRSALPAPSGFVSGWLSWGGHMAASALSALGLGIFLVELVRPSEEASFFGPNPLEVSLVALAVLALSAIAHFARVHLPIRALGRLTLAKILLIVLVTVLGVVSVFQPGPPRGFAVGAPVSSLDLMLGAGVLFIAFQGFEVVAQLSDQVKHPESSVPRGVFLALLLAFLVYGGFFLAVLGNVPAGALSGWPACTACVGGSEDMVLLGVRYFQLGQPYIRDSVLIIGVVSMYGALNSNLTAAIKTSFSMARDRLLPGILARIGGREVPPAAVALTCVGAGLLVFLTIETIAILASLAFLGLFAFVHASVIALRRGERRSAPGFRVPLVPAVPMAAIALNLALGALLWNYPARRDAPIPPGTFAMLLGGVWLAVGLAYHWIGGRRTAGRRASTTRSDRRALGGRHASRRQDRPQGLRDHPGHDPRGGGESPRHGMARRAHRRGPPRPREQHRLLDRERTVRRHRVQDPRVPTAPPPNRRPDESDLEPRRDRRPRVDPCRRGPSGRRSRGARRRSVRS